MNGDNFQKNLAALVKNLAALVVDDHLVTCKLVSGHLKGMGIEAVDTASNSQEASEKLGQKEYNIVFLDWNMPGKSGFNLLQEFRQNRQYDPVAFVMVTAEWQERYAIEALKAGANSYITKPFSREDFEEKVTQVLAWIERKSAATTKAGQN